MLRSQVQAASGGPSAAGSALFGYCAAAVLPRHRVAGSILVPCGRWGVLQGGRVGGGRKGTAGGVRCTSREVQTSVTVTQESSTKVKAVVTVKLTVGGLLANVGLTVGGLGLVDIITELIGKSLFLELVSAELDSETGEEKKPVGSYVHRAKREGDVHKYEGEVTVPKGFGEVGALLVTNEHHKEMFVQDVVLSGAGDDGGPITFSCHSWVHGNSDDPRKRIFFSEKTYLPSQTPGGLRRLREEELQVLRGDDQGERQRFERIYDYDVYNDLGNPDSGEDMARPVLGGHELPYPRRCRTGRPRTKKDSHSERRSIFVYVPWDETFSELKGATFTAKTLRSVLHALIPSLETAIDDPKLGFPLFTRIDAMFNQGLDLPLPQQQNGLLQTVLPRLVKAISGRKNNVLLFEPPALLDRDKFSWIRDEEFSRQVLAGVNPFSIQLVTEFPFVSKLDPEFYGTPESEITKEILEREMKGTMTVEQAIEEKRLFVIDYHDLLLPYVNKVRELPGTTLYGSRTVFFLTDGGTLMPMAIELTRPKSPTKPQWKKVFTHTYDATGSWLWRLAKMHVAAHDSCYHQLVIHWLRMHCCTEPYIIATNRQLSLMHPIHRLLRPHFRYTMEINALAREALINAGGTIETCFSPGKYSMELSSVAYDKLWRFDQQALPADLISRGMAVETTPSPPTGYLSGRPSSSGWRTTPTATSPTPTPPNPTESSRRGGKRSAQGATPIRRTSPGGRS